MTSTVHLKSTTSTRTDGKAALPAFAEESCSGFVGWRNHLVHLLMYLVNIMLHFSETRIKPNQLLVKCQNTCNKKYGIPDIQTNIQTKTKLGINSPR